MVVLVNTPANNAADPRTLVGDVSTSEASFFMARLNPTSSSSSILEEPNALQALAAAGDAAVTKMVLEGGLITLSEDDRRALATRPGLEELHLDGNMVAHVPARYFSVVPQLKVLSLSRNKISR